MAKKSLRARLASLIIRYKFKRPRSASLDKLTKQFDKQKSLGERPYVFPRSVKLRSDAEKSRLYDMDVYTLRGRDFCKKTVLFFSGSGYVHGPMKYHWLFCDRLVAQCAVKVVFPIYPLAPFHSYRDMYKVMVPFYNDYVSAHPDEKIIFVGDSAGGGFALAFYEYVLEHGMPCPIKVIALSPWVDITTSNAEIEALSGCDAMLVQRTAQLWGRLWADGDDMTDYKLSPLYYQSPEKLTNVHIVIGTDDILYPDVLAFYGKISNNDGCTLTVGDKMNHDYPLYPTVIPETKRELQHIYKLLVH